MIEQITTEFEGFSLLWPEETQKAGQRILEAVRRDLELDCILPAFALSDADRSRAANILRFLPTEVETIRYRQDVLADLLAQPQLTAALRELLPKIETLESYTVLPEGGPVSVAIHQVTWRLGELQILVECIDTLEAAFRTAGETVQSKGLLHLRDLTARLAHDPSFQNLKKGLPELLGRFREIASITIGVNLDPQLRPKEAVLVAVNSKPYTDSSLLQRLLGGESDELKGLAPLHNLTGKLKGPILAPFPINPPSADPVMLPLFRDLSNLTEKVSRPVAEALNRYVHFHSGFLTSLRADLTFYLGAAALMEQLRGHGLPICRPEIAPMDERVCQIEDNCNVCLALQLIQNGAVEGLILNNVQMGDDPARIWILTGPNQGGKTTFMQAVGLSQVLAQAGLFVPGRRARISPVDGIYTHYPTEERLELGTGRFGDEARRLGDIFAEATRNSLVLLNEALVGTNPGESLYLAQDVVRALRRLGARAIYTTHFHDLAANVERLNEETHGDSRIGSLVASRMVEEAEQPGVVQRSYRVLPGPPIGRSYAREIASQYGVSYEQLVKKMKERGVIA